MTTLIITLHILVCLALIMIVLLQTGKGASIGASLGGGSSQTLFGGSGASTFLSKATTIIAVVFMLTSLVLAYISGHSSQSSIMTEITAPVEQALPIEQTVPVQSVPTVSENAQNEQPAEGTPQN